MDFQNVSPATRDKAIKALEDSISEGRDKGATIDFILINVVPEISKMVRYTLLSTLKTCPGCNSDDKPGLVKEYFNCFHEWHDVNNIIKQLMTPQIAG